MEFEAKHPLYLPVSDLLPLEIHLRETRPGVKTEVFVTQLIKRWLTIDMERLSLQRDGPPLRGFQWKNVFLPEGTNLKTSYRQATEFAKVTGNCIVSDEGETFTPSYFANRQAKGRNAWRFVWLRFPGEEHWIRADDYRLIAERRRAETV